MNATPKLESFELGQFIPLHYHHVMLVDEARTRAFKEAIDLLVAPNAKVVELGGGTGILSFFAAQKASHVWYVEKNPDLYEFAKLNLQLNDNCEKIELVNMDASHFVPPEPVDVVICEMLHVGMLREKQLNVLDAFKKNYIAKFGLPLPRFIPEAAFLGVQLCETSFNFQGYKCPIMIFQDAAASNDATKGLSDAVSYMMVEYQKDFPLSIKWNEVMTCTTSGCCNSMRFVLKNIVGIIEKENRSVNWFSVNLVLPIKESLYVSPGTKVRVSFEYDAGGTIESLGMSLNAQTIKE